ncbi:sensor histidine kinase [Kribbella italica]|uniref:histidine kinase n=1 Tax=Kribbella italica TaxID=1540520 RepID=A0A7W9JAI8_9ACTN|nr:HAMP domain-containing sensor histidine kinase [Kribbella italica]MBB5838314.1 signal transduction histidine kinase [Kribbella italica]
MRLRTRLTLIYGGLFMVAGVLLLGVTYLLFTQELGKDHRVLIKGTFQPGASASPGDPLANPEIERIVDEQSKQVKAAATQSLLVQGGVALVLVGSLAAGFGWIVAGRVLAPLHRVTDTARRIAAAPAAGRGLHERIALDGPDDEVKNLADAFDTMVERLDHSFDGQRRFVANASHELRTPLTLGRALVEIAMHRKTASPDVQQLGESLLEINTRHEQLISGLLVLADSEKELTAVYPVNLADVITHVVAQLTGEATAAGVRVTAEPGDAPTVGDALLLERLVHNLVENAVRHNVDGGWVQVTSRTAPGERVEVEVSNTGPDVPPYEVEGLFKPFRRLGADRLVGAQGAGLGLSIVRSVAEAHGGTVRATARDGGGLKIVVSLPVDPG